MRVFTTFCAMMVMGTSFFASADTALNLSGTVVASPCTIDTDTVDKLVQFQSLQRMDLVTAGAGGEWQDFALQLSNCPMGTQQVTVTFLGAADDDDTTAWKNNGTATQVALRLTNNLHSTIYSKGSTQQVNVDTLTGKATFPLSARIFTPTGNAGAGTFRSVVNLDFTWQ